MLLSALSGCGAITGHQEEIDVYTKDFARTNCDVNLQKTKIEKTMPSYRPLIKRAC